jgi:hypothetical protein
MCLIKRLVTVSIVAFAHPRFLPRLSCLIRLLVVVRSLLRIGSSFGLRPC